MEKPGYEGQDGVIPLCRWLRGRLDGIGIWAAYGLTDLDYHDGACCCADKLEDGRRKTESLAS